MNGDQSADRPATGALAGIRGLLLDMDGVLVLRGRPIDGAQEALTELHRRGLPYRVVTNTSVLSRESLSAWGASVGLAVPPDRIISALSASAAYTAHAFAGRPLYVLASPDARREFIGQRLLTNHDADAPGADAAAVVIGDSPEAATFQNLNRAFRLIRGGARLIGMHKNRWWLTPDGPTLDSGAFVAGLEFATGARSLVMGKPSPAFFREAARELVGTIVHTDGPVRRPRLASIAMIGDDLWTDVLAAQRLGMRRITPMTTTHDQPRLKITYATLRNDNDQLHAQFEAGLAKVRAELLGGYHRNFVGGAERDGDGTFEKRSPIDGSVMGTFARGTRQDVRDAIAAAKGAFPAWSRRPWLERVALLRGAADAISERQMEFSALLSMEVGKNRLEALGDVEETADLIRWSCDMMERNEGFDHPMGNLGDETVHTRSVLKPYGVWGVISPFNFPFALSGGPAGGALVAGNTVVYKPSSDAPISGQCLTRAMRDAGIPDGVFNLVMGPGESVGAELQENDVVDGIIFTGSFEVGFHLYKNFARRYPKPVIVEMGGKNPAIVSRKADLDEAAEGIMRSAFGCNGQKCAANSRVYVERPVLADLTRRLVEKTEAITIGDPVDRANWLGPVINQRAVDRYGQAIV